jgi:hypothetical protein
LAQVSTTLHTLYPTLDNLVALKIIMQIVDEFGEAFGQAHAHLEDDAAQVGTTVKQF